MSSSPITGIDHPILWVSDIEKAAATYRRLGFTLSQFYVHPKAVGTANYNMMLDNDYLELLVSVEDNPRNAQRRARLAAEGDGLKDMGLRTGDADAAFETVKAVGLSPLPVFDHHRTEGNETARFSSIYLPADRCCRSRLPRHHTHARGRVARRVLPRQWRAASPAGIAPTTRRRSPRPTPGCSASGANGRRGVVSVATGRSRLRVAAGRHGEPFPASLQGAPPFVAALELFVDDTPRPRLRRGAGLPHRMAPDGAVEIPPEQACGVALRFVTSGR